MLTSVFFSQFKTFCYELEHDSKNLRGDVSQQQKFKDYKFDDAFLSKVVRDIERCEQSLLALQDSVHGQQCDQNGVQATESEIKNHCEHLLAANTFMMHSLRTHLQKYGYIDHNPEFQCEKEVCTSEPPHGRRSAAVVQTEELASTPNSTRSNKHSYTQSSSTPVLDASLFSSATRNVLQLHSLRQGDTPPTSDPEYDGIQDTSSTVVEYLQQDFSPGSHDHEIHNQFVGVDTSADSPVLPRIRSPPHTVPYVFHPPQTSEQQNQDSNANISIRDQCNIEANTFYACNSPCSPLSSNPSTPELSPSALCTTTLKKVLYLPDSLPTSTTPTARGHHSSCAEIDKETISFDDSDGSDFEDHDKSIIASLDCFSPPKTSKLLQPREARSRVSDNTETGWIPLVSQEEWNDAPSFLKLQVSADALNGALCELNKHIDATTESEGSSSHRKRHLESFSQEELEQIVDTHHIRNTPMRVVVLGLVHLKRLDICTENSIKVYRVRRFY